MRIQLHRLVIRIDRIERFHRKLAFERWVERDPDMQDYYNCVWKRCAYWLWWCVDATLQVEP